MVLYFVRVEPLRRDVSAQEIKDLLRDFGDIYRVHIYRPSPYPRYNRISKKKDFYDSTYAVVSFTDRHACLVAIANMDNTMYAFLCQIANPLHNFSRHPITRNDHTIAEVVHMGQMQVRRAIRLREHFPTTGFRS